MQIKFVSLGLAAAVMSAVSASLISVTGENVHLEHTATDVANKLYASNVANNLHAMVSSKRGLISRRKVADAIRRRHARSSENKADEDESSVFHSMRRRDGEMDEEVIDEEELVITRCWEENEKGAEWDENEDDEDENEMKPRSSEENSDEESFVDVDGEVMMNMNPFTKRKMMHRSDVTGGLTDDLPIIGNLLGGDSTSSTSGDGLL